MRAAPPIICTHTVSDQSHSVCDRSQAESGQPSPPSPGGPHDTRHPRACRLDVRRHVDRPLHGHARQPRRLHRAARHPRRPRRRTSSRCSGPSTRTRSPTPSSCSPAPRSATASAAGACSCSASRCSPPPRPPRRSRPTTDALIVARAVQGLGAAFVTPLSLTLLSDAVPGAPARPGDRRLVRRRRPRRRARPGRSAARSSTASRGTGSSGSTCRSRSR